MTATPSWQPLAMLPMFANMIDASLDDATVDRIMEMDDVELGLAALTGKGLPGRR